MTDKHTPGPWTIRQENQRGIYGNILIQDSNSHTIAELVPSNRRRGKADARLIAAAPELLEALEAAEAKLIGLIQGPDYGISGELLSLVHGAIKAAKGDA
jgi:hypothetical protein